MTLDRAHRRQELAGHPGHELGVGPGAQHDRTGAEFPPVGQADPGHRTRPVLGHTRDQAGDRRPLPAGQGGAQGAEQAAVVDLVVAGHLGPALDPRGQGGNQLPAGPAAQAGHLEAEGVVEAEQIVDDGPVRRVQRHHDRAAPPEADVEPGVGLQLFGEGRPAGGACHQQRGQALLAVVRLGHRRQHAGGHPRGAAANLWVDDGDPQAQPAPPARRPRAR